MMRLGLISDIHVDLNRIRGEDRVLPALAAEARRRCLDVLLIAGDISSDYKLTLAAVDRLAADSGAQVLFLPGNHDIWNEKHPGCTAWDTYNALLEHPCNLARGPVSLVGDWTALGDLGWYDFSYGDPSFSLEDFERMKYMDRSWQDKVKSIWDRSTLDMHRLFMGRLEGLFEALGAPARADDAASEAAPAPAGPKLVLATHVVQLREFTVQNPGPQWKYFNAFLGSPDYGDLAMRRKVKLAVCGHVHYRRSLAKSGTEFVCPCLGYQTEWPQPADPEAQVAEALAVYELGSEGAVRIQTSSVGPGTAAEANLP